MSERGSVKKLLISFLCVVLCAASLVASGNNPPSYPEAQAATWMNNLQQGTKTYAQFIRETTGNREVGDLVKRKLNDAVAQNSWWLTGDAFQDALKLPNDDEDDFGAYLEISDTSPLGLFVQASGMDQKEDASYALYKQAAFQGFGPAFSKVVEYHKHYAQQGSPLQSMYHTLLFDRWVQRAKEADNINPESKKRAEKILKYNAFHRRMGRWADTHTINGRIPAAGAALLVLATIAKRFGINKSLARAKEQEKQAKQKLEALTGAQITSRSLSALHTQKISPEVAQVLKAYKQARSRVIWRLALKHLATAAQVGGGATALGGTAWWAATRNK